MKTTSEIRDYFVNTLNAALPRLGMYGGEIAAVQLLSHLAFIDDRELELRRRLDALQDNGSFTASGVGGAFARQTGRDATDGEVGSVYANIAFRMGYLRTERTLAEAEFHAIESELKISCSTSDMSADNVRARFGTPSWQSGTNPYYPWVFLYLCPDQPYEIAFDFWNAIPIGADHATVGGEYGDIPKLRDVRIADTEFRSQFIFTPTGRAMSAPIGFRPETGSGSDGRC